MTNNWSICPACARADIPHREILELKAELSSAYGNLSEADFAELKERTDAKIEAFRAELTNDRTLKEDYEIGIDRGGLFRVVYRASCEKCGFKYEYDYEIRVIG